MPYRESIPRTVLKECTALWSETPTSPTEAYIVFRRMLGAHARDYTTYLSTAITAGGWRRDEALSMSEVVSRNTTTALRYADELHAQGLIDGDQAIDSVQLGYIPSWRQSDYLLFWFHVMARPELRSCSLESTISTFESSHDMTTLNSSQAPHEERRPLYYAFTDAYASALQAETIRPIDQTVQLIDRHRSLGGSAEMRLSRRIGARVLAPSLMTSTVDPRYFAQCDDALRQELSAIASLGGQVLEPRTPQLVLGEIT